MGRHPEDRSVPPEVFGSIVLDHFDFRIAATYLRSINSPLEDFAFAIAGRTDAVGAAQALDIKAERCDDAPVGTPLRRLRSAVRTPEDGNERRKYERTNRLTPRICARLRCIKSRVTCGAW